MIWSWNEVCYSGTPKSWIRRWRTSRKLWWSTSLKTWRRNTRILWVMWSPGHPSLGRDANLGEKSSLTSFLVVEASCEWDYDCKLCLFTIFYCFFWFLLRENRFYGCSCPVSENYVILLVFEVCSSLELRQEPKEKPVWICVRCQYRSEMATDRDNSDPISKSKDLDT